MGRSLIIGSVVCIACLSYVASVPLTEQRQNSNSKSPRDLFTLYDVNKDNHLDAYELVLLAVRDQSAISEQLDVIISMVNDVFDNLEQDGDGKIAFSEFETLFAGPADFATNAEVLGMYQLFDLNRDGNLSVTEVALALFDGALTADNRKNIEAVDTDSNGRISYAEFASAMRQHPVVSTSVQ
ncbi:Calmodulin-like protein 30 [Holothuria leucospilota]|uniref:Calmodulin-like protein 30 n=1 Tax=Holothuria leucospilota TaxID=206669 RepID=A0A9Q1BT30_HOLLE|nr:Calmodulin-like protein 30 [Holothuria leucospilota]